MGFLVLLAILIALGICALLAIFQMIRLLAVGLMMLVLFALLGM